MNLPEKLAYLLTGIDSKIIEPFYTHNFIQIQDDRYPGLSCFKCIKCKHNATYIFWERNHTYDITNTKPYTCDEIIIKGIID